MTSPSSQPIRSRSNQDRWTWLALPPHGQLRSWASLALQTASMFLADASTLLTSPRVPGVESRIGVEGGLGGVERGRGRRRSPRVGGPDAGASFPSSLLTFPTGILARGPWAGG